MMLVRAAVENDIPYITELYKQLSLGGSNDEAEIEAEPAAYLKQYRAIKELPGCELFVAEEDGQILGTAMVMIVPGLTHGARPWATVEFVVVESAKRGTGIGKAVMDRAKELALEAGCYKIQLLSHKSRTEAHKFYHAIGYSASAEGFRMYL